MSDFTSQYGTNLAATLTMAGIAGLVWCVKHKCRHSKCELDSRCFKCSADDEATIREQPRVPQPGAINEV